MFCICFGFFLGSCSVYRVVHDETPVGDQTHYRTAIFQMVPPGGKELSSGQANISSQSSDTEKWRIKIGADLQTDMTGTAVLIDSLVGRIAELTNQLAILQTPAAVIPQRPAPPAPPQDDGALNR